MMHPKHFMKFFYSLALCLLLPYIFLHLLWRSRKQPEYLHHIAERFGFYPVQCARPIIWLHAVSVGETRAVQNLISRLLVAYPQHQILLTHGTPTGRAASIQLYGDGVLRVYLPYDYPFAVNRFLKHFKPEIGILMETEIWFNLIHACQKSTVPLLLLNARMSDKSARNYARFARLTAAALNGISAVAAQTTDDARRLTMLGAHHVTLTGNLKFDIAAPPAMLELGARLRQWFGVARKVLLLASTREGEEILLLDALNNLHIPGLLLVLVPRHPQRFAEVALLLEQRGIPYQRRTEYDLAAPVIKSEIRVVLGDSMGEMFAYYAAADLAFIGGSLLPFGGQNLIESCAAGTPVLIGPHTYNFAEATRQAVAAKAAVQVQDSGELVHVLERLMDSPDALQEMQHNCAGFVETNRGATEKSLQIIIKLLYAAQSKLRL
jgi:3-deoxy-D-manno-octulosonic-acid transferase